MKKRGKQTKRDSPGEKDPIISNCFYCGEKRMLNDKGICNPCLEEEENQDLVDRLNKLTSLAEIERRVPMPPDTLRQARKGIRSVPMKYRAKLKEVLNDLNL